MAWSIGSNVTAGSVLTASRYNQDVLDNLRELAPFMSAWTAYTPLWTSAGTQPAVGNGTASGRYLVIGKWAVVEAGVRFGSTSTYGTGAYFLSVPSVAQMRDNAAVNGKVVGMAFAEDAGSAMYPGWASREDAGKVFMSVINASGTYGLFNSVSPTVPFTMGNGDGIFIRLAYEVS